MGEADAFIVSDLFYDAWNVVLGSAEIDETDAHAEPHDVGFTHPGELLHFIDLLKQVVRECDGDGLGFHEPPSLTK
jgi:hypothetical protein